MPSDNLSRVDPSHLFKDYFFSLEDARATIEYFALQMVIFYQNNCCSFVSLVVVDMEQLLLTR